MAPAEQPVTLNDARQRFELVTDGKISFVVFEQPDEHTLALTHTEVHHDLEGKGIGSRLVKEVLGYAEAHNQKIVPLCPFVATYIKRHPDWQRVVSTDYSDTDF